MPEATLHRVAVAGGPLPGEPLLIGGMRPLVGPFDPPVHRVSGPAALLDEAAAGLPAGPASAEAIAVRLRRRGVTLGEGEPALLDRAALLEWSRARGAHSVALVRAAPDLLPELQLGAHHQALAGKRAARRLLSRLPPAAPAARTARGRALKPLADAAFWAGVRSAATRAEWLRLTRGYTALLYHRLAGEMKPGQETLDLPPERFAAQMRLLRALRFHPLSLAEAAAFHADPRAVLPRRACLVTADDGFADCTPVLIAHAARRPALFVPTQEAGGRARWNGGEPVSGWDELTGLRAAGGELGAHSRTHADLPELPDDRLDDEVGGALADLERRAPGAPPTFAYPYGHHDARVREAARRAGVAIAYTTAVGANGAGTDPWCLRRATVKAYHSLPAFVFLALTAEHLPVRWDRRLRRRDRAAGRPSSPPAAA
jgi:peptidoglycan/xylan/chitin deacetylase (PgdA/CDA1 family)